MSILRMDIRGLFGGNLRRLRLAAKLSQEAVAERIGVDRAHVSAMERGVQNVTLETLGQVAVALGVLPSELLAEGENLPEPGTKVARRPNTKSS